MQELELMGKAKRDKKGRFSKGSPAPKTAFKKGGVPWNKGTKDLERERERKRRWEQEHPEVRQRYLKRNRGRIRAYMHDYYGEHKEQFKEKGAKYRAENKEAIREKDKKYYEENKEKIAEKAKAYRAENREKIIKGKKDYYQKNRERLREKGRIWRERNRERANEMGKVWKQKNRERVRYHCRLRKARKKGAGGKFTLDEWLGLVLETGGVCPACKKRVGKTKLIPDHIVPLSKGGTNDISNIQPLCPKCNLKKATKTIRYI